MLKGVFEAPGSSANVGPGYDVFAIALEKPCLTLTAEIKDGDGVSIEIKGKYKDEVPSEPYSNAAGKAVQSLLETMNLRKHVKLVIEASIPPRKGLGASGAEAAAAVYALNKLLKLGLSKEEMVAIASQAEPGGHMDNVSASIYGGFVVCLRDELGLRVVSIQPPKDLGLVVVVPDVVKESTAAARKAVPEYVGMRLHLDVAAKMASAVAAACLDDVELFLRSVAFDPLIESRRADAGVYGRGITSNYLLEEKRILFRSYGVAEVISGAGPSRLLLFNRRENTGEVGKRKVDGALTELTHRIEKTGAKVLEIIETTPNLNGCREIV